VQERESATARRVILGLSAVVVLVVAVLVGSGPRAGAAAGPHPLATFNAVLNAAATLCLLAGWAFVRTGRIALHRAAMIAAFTCSTLFLAGYVLHHARVGSVPFRGEGLARVAYLALLVPHVILAAAITPAALLTLYRGLRRDDERHRAIARRTLPLWLFVSASGVALYFLLYSRR